MKSFPWMQNRRAWMVLLLAMAAAYFTGLGNMALLGRDEPRYAQVAREMWQRGDWVTPTLGGHTWFEKPALLYWMMMAAFNVVGVSEGAARFGSACAGVLSILLLGWLGMQVERAAGGAARYLGWAAAGVLASCGGMIAFAHGASFDIVLTCGVTLCLTCFLAADLEAEATRRNRLLAGFWAGMGVSLLAKGLVGIILPAGVVGLYLLLQWRWPGARRLGLGWGPLLTLVVAALWYGPVIARHGYPFINEFFVQHHFARFTSDKFRHHQPFYFYLPIMALLCLPWTAFLLSALWNARRWNWRDEDAPSRLRVFGLAWLIVPVAFFSISGSKLPGYVLPALPGAALLVAEPLARLLRGEAEGVSAVLRLTGAVLLCLALAIVVYAARSEALPLLRALLIAVPLAGAAVLALRATPRRADALRLGAGGAVIATLAAAFLINNLALETMTRRNSVRDLMRQAAEQGYATAPLLQYQTTQRTTEFYAANRVEYGPDGEPVELQNIEQVARHLRGHQGPVLILTRNRDAEQVTASVGTPVKRIGDNGVVTLLAVEK